MKGGLMQEKARITGARKNVEPLYSDILKLSKEKNITVVAARNELLKKMEGKEKIKWSPLISSTIDQVNW